MPICRECGRMQATAEMRKSKKKEGGFVCKDSAACKAIAKERSRA